jgi:hypothetical protein
MYFMVFSLPQWLFSKKHPLDNAEYALGMFVQLLMSAAQAKVYVETISSLAGTQTGLYNHGSKIQQVQGMVKERRRIARASRETEQRQDNIQNKHICCDIACL